MLPALVALALVAFAVALLGPLHAGRIATLHLILAVGAMPLIFGAMSHFIPVLTRTRAPGAKVASLPVLALTGAVLAMIAFSIPDVVWGRYAGAFLAMLAAALLLAWSRHRRAGMLGRPHPGLAWYQAALTCLVFALAAILASAIWPQQWVELRRLHLHLNTLGFIGLTALGTLSVLLPTVAGRPDPEAGPWLRRNLPWAMVGTALVAVGAAWFSPLAWIGLMSWAIPLSRLGTRWLRLYHVEIFALHGAAPLLAAAVAGFAASLLFGAAAVFVPVLSPISAFVAGFLLPLVSGAVSQLLPVWLRPGMQGDWHTRMRRRLGRYGGIRAALFGVSGIAGGTGQEWGLLLGVATLLWFMVQAVAALVRANVIRQETP